MAQTWNDAGTTFTAIKMDVTDTSSASGSKLMDLLVGGTTKFDVSKTGDACSMGSTGYTVPAFCIGDRVNGLGFGAQGTVTGTLIANSIGIMSWHWSNGVMLKSDRKFGWGNANVNGSHDTEMHRDAADTIAQRRGTNANTYRIYNTYTDASNYERAALGWSSNVFEIGTENAGTGSARATDLTDADLRMSNLPTSDPAVAGRLWNNSGVLNVSAG